MKRILNYVKRETGRLSRELGYATKGKLANYPFYIQQVVDGLETRGVNLELLNRYFDENGFPKETGRFPELFLKRDDLVMVALSFINKYKPITESSPRIHHRRSKRLAEIIGKEMASAWTD
jgi:hypothetical protein